MIGQSVGSDASPLSCFLFRPRKSRKSAGNAVIPTFPTHWSHGLQHLRHKRRNVRFKGLRRVHTPPHLLTAHTAAHRAKHGAFRMGWYHYPRSVPHVSETLRGRDLKRQTLPLLGLGRGCSRRTQRAFGTAMRMMRVAVPRRRGPAGLRDPIAVSLTAPMGFAVLVDRDYRVRKKAHFVFMRRAVLPALPAPSAALLYALMH